MSTSVLAVSKALNPAMGTAKPSASVDSISTGTGLPSCRALEKPAHLSDSTPLKTNSCLFTTYLKLIALTIILTFGLSVFTANATPAIKPPPLLEQ